MTIQATPPLLLIFLTGGAAGCHSAGGPCQPPASADRIAFVMDTTDAKQNIYTINPDGSGLKRLTRSTHMNRHPEWSPDGARIAFLSNRGGYFLDLYVMCADGSQQRRLTRASDQPGAQEVSGHTWSPDGLRLVFQESGELAITVIHPDGTGRTRLTRGTDPAWSVDGRHIAFGSDRTGTPELYLIGADGSDLRRLTRIGELGEEYARAGGPAWSPEGNHIAFEIYRGGSSDIAVVQPDGTAEQRLTGGDPVDDERPRWSPDGRQIAFLRGRPASRDDPETRELWVMDRDGGGQTRLASGLCDGHLGFSWSPDSRQLVFARGCREWEAAGIWIVAADGSGLRPLVGAPAFAPEWSR